MHLRPSLASLVAVLLASVTVTATTCEPDGCSMFQSDLEFYLYKHDYTYPAQVKEMNIIPFTTPCCPKFDYNKFLLQLTGVSLTEEDGVCKCLDLGGIDHFVRKRAGINDHLESFVLVGNFADKSIAFSAQLYRDSGCALNTEIGCKWISSILP
jgi:hypothetical protein